LLLLPEYLYILVVFNPEAFGLGVTEEEQVNAPSLDGASDINSEIFLSLIDKTGSPGNHSRISSSNMDALSDVVSHVFTRSGLIRPGAVTAWTGAVCGHGKIPEILLFDKPGAFYCRTLYYEENKQGNHKRKKKEVIRELKVFHSLVNPVFFTRVTGGFKLTSYLFGKKTIWRFCLFCQNGDKNMKGDLWQGRLSCF